MVSAQSDMRPFEGVECIEGALAVYRGPKDDPVVDLAPLSALRAVTEEVGVSDTLLTDLHGLEGVEWIGQQLSIGGLTPGVSGCNENPNLESLDAFAGLQHVGSLLVCGDLNDSLVSIDALDAALEGHFQGKIELSYLRELSSIAPLEGVTNAELGLVLVELPMLVDLSPLNALAEAGAITIARTSIQDLVGLESLETVVDRLGIVANDQLVSLAGIENIIHVGALYITDNINLPQEAAEELASSIDVEAETVICGNLGGPPC
jgi:hypothetical protein